MQVLVYGGGIMVLFLFVIMLVNLHRLQEVKIYGMQWPAALLLAVLLIGLVIVGGCAELTVGGAIGVAAALNVSETFIAVIIIGKKAPRAIVGAILSRIQTYG